MLENQSKCYNFSAPAETRILGSKAGLVQRNVGEGYEFEAEIYVERNGCQYDMKLHPPIPSVQNSMYHFADAILNNKPHTATGEVRKD